MPDPAAPPFSGSQPTQPTQLTQRRIAAVDLGSNSFHMIIVGVDAHGHVNIRDKLRESVRLRAGLDADNALSPPVQQRALDCLQRFGERIRGFAPEDVAAVGTNTLRQASEARSFLDQAEQALGQRISIISGAEEARLIYLGVSHTLIEPETQRRFVMDIGGGSTELILGQGFQPDQLASLNMGCVSSSQRFFPDGELGAEHWQRAILAARLKLEPIAHQYKALGWHSVAGASGTIKAVLKMIQQCGLSPYTIILPHLYTLRALMQEAGHVDQLAIPGLSDERRPVIAGGLAILIATFEALGLEEMQVSEGALREGLVYDRIERLQYGDLRSKTVAAVQARFHIDSAHAQQVSATASRLFTACRQGYELSAEWGDLLGWAAGLHEAGLAISHSSYHKHSAYLLRYLDLLGFSSEEQVCLSVLVRAHRRKISRRLFDELAPGRVEPAVLTAIVLRLAVLMHRSRNRPVSKLVACRLVDKHIRLTFSAPEVEASVALLVAGLEEEQTLLRAVGFELSYEWR